MPTLRFHVELPGAIPRNLFDNLDGIRDSSGKRYDCIVKRLDNDYRRVEKDTYSHGASPVDAIAQVFNRNLGNSRSAKSLIKMFRDVAGNYAREEPIQALVQPIQHAQIQGPKERAQGELNLF